MNSNRLQRLQAKRNSLIPVPEERQNVAGGLLLIECIAPRAVSCLHLIPSAAS